eukprot:1150585-Pelagomonas_calceolata.AAC.3
MEQSLIQGKDTRAKKPMEQPLLYGKDIDGAVTECRKCAHSGQLLHQASSVCACDWLKSKMHGEVLADSTEVSLQGV